MQDIRILALFKNPTNLKIVNTKIEGSIRAAIEPANCKKVWVKPEVEMISKDIIEGGIITTLHEGQTTFGFRGQYS